MSMISKLKLTDKTRTTLIVSEEQRLRDKLVGKLVEQKEIAEADMKGEPIAKTRMKGVTDKATGEGKQIEVAKQVRRWWWTDENGVLMLTLRYGNKPLPITGNKATIEVGTIDKLVATIDMIIEAVMAGELDDQLKAAASERRRKAR